MSRQDQYSVTLTVEGQLIGVYDKMEGGSLTSQSVKYRRGNMGNEEALGGARTVEDVTVTALFDHTVEHRNRLRFLMSHVGSGSATIVKQPLDRHGNPNVDPFVYVGILMTATLGPADANSNEADTYDLVILTEGEIG